MTDIDTLKKYKIYVINLEWKSYIHVYATNTSDAQDIARESAFEAQDWAELYADLPREVDPADAYKIGYRPYHPTLNVRPEDWADAILSTPEYYVDEHTLDLFEWAQGQKEEE